MIFQLKCKKQIAFCHWKDTFYHISQHFWNINCNIDTLYRVSENAGTEIYNIHQETHIWQYIGSIKHHKAPFEGLFILPEQFSYINQLSVWRYSFCNSGMISGQYRTPIKYTHVFKNKLLLYIISLVPAIWLSIDFYFDRLAFFQNRKFIRWSSPRIPGIPWPVEKHFNFFMTFNLEKRDS